MVVIHPDECIDCGACVPECPVSAIFDEDDLPEKWNAYSEINRRFSIDAWPNITQEKTPLATAEEFKDVENKRALLIE